MKTMFNPETVALIGATEKEGSVGRTILDNLITSHKRRIYPVNPKRKTILGIDCYPDIASVPESIDLAVIVIPAHMVPGIVEECGKADVRGVIIISAGFRETGLEGKQFEEQIIVLRKKYGMRIVGPNCLGIIRPTIDLNASFLNVSPLPGKIAFISQSGALGSAILDWAVEARIGFSMFASLGSMIDIDFGDFIDFLGEDPYTRSIMLYMESVEDARKFMSAARRFARNKPIIVVKPGRFTESAKAALSHTGSMAGDDQVYDAAFKRVGALRVKEVSDLFNASEVLHSKYLPKGSKLAIVTNAGGLGVMATDKVIELNGELADLSEKSIKKLDSVLPEYWSKGNPIDILGDSNIDRYLDSINISLKDPGVDGIIVLYSPQGLADPNELALKITEIAGKSSKPIITVWTGGKRVKASKEIFLNAKVPFYNTPEDAVKTYMHMYQYSRNLKLLYEAPSELSVDQAPPKHHLKALIKKLIKEKRYVLSELESKDFMINYGIPINECFLATTVDEALSHANSIGYPVALKIVSHDITHKSDVGGVVLGIRSDDELKDKYNKVIKNISEKLPKASITGFSVQKMIEHIDYEIILGAKTDKDFGTVILFGMGGVGTEIYRDFSIGIPPLNQTLALRLMEETKVFNTLKGFRGKTPADIRQLEHIIVCFSNLIVDFPEISEIDINPLAISDGKAYVLDARIILKKNIPKVESPYSHLVITPYPTRYVTPWKLTDGTEVLLRPIRPEDEPLEHEMLTTLSEKTLEFRFFQVIKNIDHEMLTRFCNIDYDREMAIIAEITTDGKKRMIGIGRLIIEQNYKDAEFAIVVHDDFSGRGLGYKLVDMLIGIAQEKDIERIYGEVLTINTKMLSVAEKLGFTLKQGPEGLSHVELILK